MLKHPIINKEYVDPLQEIRYLGEAQCHRYPLSLVAKLNLRAEQESLKI